MHRKNGQFQAPWDLSRGKDSLIPVEQEAGWALDRSGSFAYQKNFSSLPGNSMLDNDMKFEKTTPTRGRNNISLHST